MNEMELLNATTVAGLVIILEVIGARYTCAQCYGVRKRFGFTGKEFSAS